MSLEPVLDLSNSYRNAGFNVCNISELCICKVITSLSNADCSAIAFVVFQGPLDVQGCLFHGRLTFTFILSVIPRNPKNFDNEQIMSC
jgi:hypothetical protein